MCRLINHTKIIAVIDICTRRRHKNCHQIDVSLSTKDSLLLMFLAGPPRADQIASMTNRIKNLRTLASAVESQRYFTSLNAILE